MILRWNKPSITKIQGIYMYPGKNNVIPAELEEKVKKDPFVLEKLKVIGQNGKPLIEIIDRTPKKVVQPNPKIRGDIEADDKEVAGDEKTEEKDSTLPLNPDTDNESEDESIDESKDETTEDITEMNSEDAIAVINKKEDVEELNKMLEVESRKGVKKAIKSRIVELL